MNEDQFKVFMKTLESFTRSITSIQQPSITPASTIKEVSRAVDAANVTTVIGSYVYDENDDTVAQMRDVITRYESRSSDAKLKSDSMQPHCPTSDEVYSIRPGKRNQKKFSKQFKKSSTEGSCFRCGRNDHRPDKCKFINAKCFACEKMGHIAPVCRSKTELKHIRLCDIVSNQCESARTFVSICIGGHSVKFQCDSGADITTIGTDVWIEIGKPALQPLSRPCRGFGNVEIKARGYFTTVIEFNNKSVTVPILVAFQNDYTLLGNVPLRDLGIVSWNIDQSSNIEVNSLTVNDVQSKFPALFSDGMGACNKKLVHLNTSPEARPVHLRNRSVDSAVQPLLERELDRLVTNGTIEKVDTSDLATPIVVVRKANGNIRLCADFSTGLNAALTPDVYPLPNMDEMMTKFTGNRVFSKIDLSEAYFQLLLNEDSKPLTTVSTHKSLFQFKRLPFGIKTEASIFQRVMDNMLAGIENCYAYQDDIVVFGPDKDSHDQTLNEVLDRLLYRYRPYDPRARVI